MFFRSDGTKIEADAVVNASGSRGTHRAARAGVTIPLELVPGLVVYTQAGDTLPRPIIA